MLTKEATYKDAIQKLLAFREEMFEQITQIVSGYPDEAFAKMPFVTCAEDRICPNMKCCKEKDLDGCYYECDELENCNKGFYIPSNDGANAAKAQPLKMVNL